MDQQPNTVEIASSEILDQTEVITVPEKVSEKGIHIVKVDSDSGQSFSPIPVILSKSNKSVKRKSGLDVIQFSTGSENESTASTPNIGKTKWVRSDAAEDRKKFIKLIRSYPVLFDAKFADNQKSGAKKAAYEAIAKKLGLQQKQVSQLWYNIYTGYIKNQNEPLLDFLKEFLQSNEPSTSGINLKKQKVQSSNKNEKPDNDRKDNSVESNFNDDSLAGKQDRPHFIMNFKNQPKSKESDGAAWHLPDNQFIEYINKTFNNLNDRKRKKLKKRIVRAVNKSV